MERVKGSLFRFIQLVGVVFCCVTAFALPASGEEREGAYSSFGLGTRYTYFRHTTEGNLYKVDPVFYTTIEGEMGVREGFKLAFNAKADPAEMDKAEQIAGLLGYGNYFIRAEYGRMTGTFRSENSVSGKTLATTEIDEKLFIFDLLYSYKEVPGAYYGLRYVKYSLPMTVNTNSWLYEFFDPSVTFESYGFVYLVDSLRQDVHERRQNAGGGSYALVSVSLGLGKAKLSPEGVRNAKMQSWYPPLEYTESTGYSADIELNLGYQQVWNTSAARFGFALGIGYHLFTFLDLHSQEVDSDASSIEPYLDNQFIDYGPSFRFLAAW